MSRIYRCLLLAMLCAALLCVGCTSSSPSDETEGASLTTTGLPTTATTAAFAEGPRFVTDTTVYRDTAVVTVTFAGTDSKDWIGVYPKGAAPGGVNAIVWQYAEGDGVLTFAANTFGGAGEYTLYLCDNDGYEVLYRQDITVTDGDMTDYGAADVTAAVRTANGYNEIDVTVTPGRDSMLTYSLYWSCGERRLPEYLPLMTVEHSGLEPFTVSLNDCVFMPSEADGIEVAVNKGASASRFVTVDALKVPDAEKLYEFQVITDLHIAQNKPQHTVHLKAALADIAALSPDSEAIISVGDNTDRGTVEDYDLLNKTIASVDAALPPIYFAIGNHDLIYGNNYQSQVFHFLNELSMEAVHYAGDIGNTRFIVLGSDVQKGEGELLDEQLEWLKAELAAADPEKPVFLFLHQPLKDTVSGSLYSLDPDVQYWYGLEQSGDTLRAILKDYPNAILFTGHTHWSFEMFQPLLFGGGEDATFANAASVGYLWSDDDEAIGGSEGYYVEVYEDFVLLRGREYTEGKWCAAAQFMIPLF